MSLTVNAFNKRHMAPLLLASIGFSFGLGCTSHSPSQTDAYAPVFAKPAASGTQAQRGTVQGDYDWAARSGSLQEAATRWEEFLRAHDPPNGEYEDGFEKSHVDAGKYELARAYYLLGQASKGDALLKKLNPLGL